MILIAVLLCYNRNSDYTDLRMPVKVKMHVSRPLTGILKSAEIQISDRSKAVIVQSRSRLQIISNPPYNIDIAEWDNYPNYLSWAAQWINEIHRILSPRGNFVLFGGFQYCNTSGGDLLELFHYIRNKTPFRLTNVIIWYYHNGMWAQRFFSNRHEEIIWFTKTDKYLFDLDAVRIKYDKETLELYKKDKRLQEKNLLKGKNPSNVWEISRLNSNSKERVGHVTQKPEAIMRRIIKSMSAERDIVLDAFAGSTVAAKVCIEENRNSISCDIDPKSTDYFQTQLSRIKHSHDYIVTNNLEDLFGQLRRN